ncbi:MAG: DUF2510 domain-containing protein [Acidimicrobiia bacterium]|nr:DUF2510 domain-containing protein [Acidimicrobiia bacterium]
MSEQTPAGWQPDPTGRHEHRYWDGIAWSDNVSDAGLVATDPFTEAAPSTPEPTADQPSGGKKNKGILIGSILALIVVAVVVALVATNVNGGDDEAITTTTMAPDESVRDRLGGVIDESIDESIDELIDEAVPEDFRRQFAETLAQNFDISPREANCLSDKLFEAFDPRGDSSTSPFNIQQATEYFESCGISIENLIPNP